jgi:hypothetical protein
VGAASFDADKTIFVVEYDEDFHIVQLGELLCSGGWVIGCNGRTSSRTGKVVQLEGG